MSASNVPSTLYAWYLEFIPSDPVAADEKPLGILVDYLRILAFHFDSVGSDTPGDRTDAFNNLPALQPIATTTIDTSETLHAPSKVSVMKGLSEVLMGTIGLKTSYQPSLDVLVEALANDIVLASTKAQSSVGGTHLLRQDMLELCVVKAVSSPPVLGDLQCEVTTTANVSQNLLGKTSTLEITLKGSWSSYGLNPATAEQALQLISDLKASNEMASFDRDPRFRRFTIKS